MLRGHVHRMVATVFSFLTQLLLSLHYKIFLLPPLFVSEKEIYQGLQQLSSSPSARFTKGYQILSFCPDRVLYHCICILPTFELDCGHSRYQRALFGDGCRIGQSMGSIQPITCHLPLWHYFISTMRRHFGNGRDMVNPTQHKNTYQACVKGTLLHLDPLLCSL